jgi:hypothetical protein
MEAGRFNLEQRNMNSEAIDKVVNVQMVESILQLIRSLPRAERNLLEQRLLEELPDFTTDELMQLSERGGAFDFWHHEPEIYTLEDGEPIQW